VIVATGAKYRRWKIPEISRFVGRSISIRRSARRGWCATLTWPCRGSNSAGQAAIHLAAYARRVTLVVRAHSLESGMSDYLVRQIRLAPNIEVRLGAEVVGAEGDGLMERLAIRDKESKAVETIAAKMLFVLIGAMPHTDWLAGAVQRDAKGFILTGHDVDLGAWPIERKPMTFENDIPGIFAAAMSASGP